MKSGVERSKRKKITERRKGRRKKIKEEGELKWISVIFEAVR